VVKIINRQVKGLPKINWARGKPTVIVAHETANPTSTVNGEINFMTNNYKKAFYHYIAGEDGFYMVHNPDTGGAWGAGPSMHNYAIHVELIRSSTKTGFNKAYKNYVDGIKYLADKYDIPLKVDSGTDKRGIYTHNYVTKTFGGTTHTDPVAYFKQYDKTISQFAKDLGDSSGSVSTSKPASKPTSKPATSGGSVVDYLKSKKINSSYNNRKKLAAKHGIKNYKGTEAQNNNLLSKLKGGSKPTSKPAKKKVTGKTADIQRKLNEYKVNNITVDNLKGPKTYKALRKAYQYELNRQFSAGLVVDGLAGPKTDNAAVTLYESKTYGNLAYLTQAMLYFKGYNIAVDGYWQSDSVKVTKLYQRDVKLTADGKPGKATYKKLIRF